DLSNFNTENVTDMTEMFYLCSALTELNVSGFNTEKVTDMGGMFRNCSSLSSLDVSKFNTSNVTDMSYMFSWCRVLTSLDLSNFNTEKVTIMDGMFYECSALSTIYCNDAWTCSNSEYMFYLCTSLKGAVSYSSSKTDVSMANPETGYFTATTIEAYAVENDTTLTFYYDYKRATRTGKVYNIGSTNGNTYITKAVFDAPFKTYLPTNTASWLQNCTKLETIEGIENLNTENVTDMSNMFNGCSALTELDVTGFNTEKVTDMEGMFSNCCSLSSLDVSKFNTSKVTNMGSMFDGCRALTTIYCNDTWTCDKSTDMFYGCTSLVGAVAYDANYVDVTMANPETGYFTKGGATSVSAINTDNGNRATVIYNLHGIKMQGDLQSLPAGIYIVNGKKVIVK
ncbi:MAG: BspA family leucine-rich repeat surface protein, partial [Prevotella sp.]